MAKLIRPSKTCRNRGYQNLYLGDENALMEFPSSDNESIDRSLPSQSTTTQEELIFTLDELLDPLAPSPNGSLDFRVSSPSCSSEDSSTQDEYENRVDFALSNDDIRSNASFD